jgi:transposase-like protein
MEVLPPMPTSRSGSPFDRPRWNEDDAREVIAALHRSGKPVSVFAVEHGIDPQRVYLWRRRLGGAERTTFQELVVRRSSARDAIVAEGAPFEIVLPSGSIVRVPASFDATALARLLEVLAQASAC